MVIFMRVELYTSNLRIKKIIKFLFFLLFLIVVLLISYSTLYRFKPVFEDKALCAAKNKANAVLNNAVTDVLSGIDTDEMVNINLNNTSEISSITTNTTKLNLIKSKVYKKIDEYLENSNTTTIYIPIGSLTDFPVLQGIGYRIPIKIVFDTTISMDFSDSITEAGINQAYHETFIIATANIDIISSVLTTSDTVNIDIPISQTLIIGNVPNTYYGY